MFGIVIYKANKGMVSTRDSKGRTRKHAIVAVESGVVTRIRLGSELFNTQFVEIDGDASRLVNVGAVQNISWVCSKTTNAWNRTLEEPQQAV